MWKLFLLRYYAAEEIFAEEGESMVAYNRFSEKHQSLTDTLQQLSNDRLYLQVSAGAVSPDLCYSNPESWSKAAIAVVQ